jgi:hypothetical protein
VPAPDEDPVARLEKIKQAAHLKHVVGLTWDETAKATGFSSGAACQTIVKRHMRKVARDTEKELEPMIAQLDMRYDAMRKRIHGILSADHPVVQNGVIVRDANGVPLKDAGPTLAALNTWLNIEKSWSATHGTDASKKLEIALEQRGELESNLVAEAVLAAVEALGLEPQQRMLALEAAADRLHVIDGEVIEDDRPE